MITTTTAGKNLTPAYTITIGEIIGEFEKAKSRQAVLNCYWKHKAQHERLLKKHLKEEMAQVNRIKSKIKYR